MSLRWLASIGAELVPPLARHLAAEAGLDSSVAEVRESFDRRWYEQEAGRRFASLDAALAHYHLRGSRQGLRPCAAFSPGFYRDRYPDVVAAGYEPFAHYLHFGRHEGRFPSPDEDEQAIVVPDVTDLQAMLRHRTGIELPVDVVVPVYNSRALTLQAIESVLALEERGEVVVVNDASTDATLCAELRALAERKLITLLENEANLGFVGSVNRGIALHRDRDIVLLNSDTRVFGNWLPRLLRALGSASDVATATPMSNAATIMSYPLTLRENAMGPAEGGVLDALLSQQETRLIDVPTGVGFCMAIRRACIEEIGGFDAGNFGRGYGEENDFCLRASASGWRHVAATGLFVWHRGGGSFAAEREGRLRQALATLERLYPGYGETIRRFIAADPLRPARAALDIARLRADPRPRHLTIGSAGMTERDEALTLTLVADVGPFRGKFAFTVPGLRGIASLPRVEPDISVESLTSLLQSFAISAIRLGEATRLPPALRRSLSSAAETAGIEVTSLGLEPR